MNKKAWKRRVLSLVVVFAMLLTNVPVVFASEQAGPVYPTFAEVYDSMTGLKKDKKYSEGAPWTNSTPYGKDGPDGSYYQFKGGKVNGGSLGVGCAAFAFLLSDAAFGNLPAYTYNHGDFKFEDVKTGDILRINNSHFVVVLEKRAGGVIVAEGNYNKSVHWGRAMSGSEVENANFIVSRYPKDYKEDNQDADKIKEEGTEGNLGWTLTNSGTLTVTVTGGAITAAIPDYDDSANTPPWKAYKGNIDTIVIGQGITAIGKSAFRGLGASRVFLPDTVKTIGDAAFQDNGVLLSVTIPGSVETIGNDAFRECNSLASVTISEGVKTIGERAFHSCTQLQYIDFPKSIQSIGAGAFTSCENMLQVRFMPGTGNVTIGDNPFMQSWRLVYVALPDGLDKLSPGMFESCKSIQDLYIPASVKSLGEVGTTSPFMSAEIANIYFGGTKEAWDTMMNSNPQLKATMPKNVVIHYESPFEDPSASNGDDGFIKDGEASPTQTAAVAPETPSPTQTAAVAPETPSPTQTAAVAPKTPSPAPTVSGNTGSSGWSIWPSVPETPSPSPTPIVAPTQTAAVASETPSPAPTATAAPDTPKPAVTPDLPLPSAASGGGDTVEPASTSKPTKRPASTPEPTKKPGLATVKKQLNSSIKSQLQTKLKTQLANKLQKKYGKKSKAQLKKSLKTELKAKLKPVIKANMKKKYGKQLGKKFTTQFNAKYNAQYNAIYNKQFEQVYKKVSKSKKKKK
ncbi:MAG: leucine-rich repeat protein [Lachnospiraceae bacterium]|nr:leucine-rich repeat protein [Lachnospiraceae bacterium]